MGRLVSLLSILYLFIVCSLLLSLICLLTRKSLEFSRVQSYIRKNRLQSVHITGELLEEDIFCMLLNYN